MSNKSKLKIGIIGCGTIAGVQAQAIQESENLDLVSAFSRSEKNARAFGDKFNIEWNTNWDRFINNPELDAVSICSPNGNHLDYGEKAAKAGKHVIVEKPIEINVQRGKQLIRVCEENRVALAVIYQSRFISEIRNLKSKFDKQEFGKIFMGDANIKWFRGQDYYDSGEWRGSLALDGGGVLINQAIHTIDLLQWFMGDVESVYGKIATLTHQKLEGEDNAVAVLKFKSGALGVIQGSTSIQPAQPRKIEFHGEKGTVVIDGDDVILLKIDSILSSQGKKKPASGASSPLAGFSIEPHKNQFESIAKAISNGTEPPVSGKESLKSLAIVQAIYESSKTNSPIKIDDYLK